MNANETKDAYRRAMKDAGWTVLFRRYTGTGTNRPRFDVPVRARIVDYQPHELSGLIVQGDRKAILLVEDMVAAQVPLDIRKGDKIVDRGKELNIEAPDNNTRRVQGELIAYELQVRG